MATLTTTDGIQITFVGKAVSALTDHDASTGEAVTCVYGITNSALRLIESVQAFMTRIKIADNFAKLTRPNGFPVWINGAAVSSIRAPLSNEYVMGVNTVIFANGLTQGVKEPPPDVTMLINSHGGGL